MKNENIDFGNRLRLILDELKVSQVSLARSMGKGESWISKILDGERGMKATDVFKVARILNIPADELSPFKNSEPRKEDPSDDDLADQLLLAIKPSVLEKMIARRGVKKT